MDFRNNVLFNWQHRSVDGAGPEAHVNMVNNYYKSGPATNSGQLMYRIVKPELRNGVVGNGAAGWWYVEGNFVNGYPNVTADNWNGGVQFDLPGMQQSWVRVFEPHTHVEFPDDPDDPNDDVNGVPIPIPDLPVVATQSAQDAYQWVLAHAGASLVRDAVDVRITNSVATGVATAGPNANGIITDISQVGGFPVIPFVERGPDFDVDQDGIADQWEREHALDPSDSADRNGDFDADGYTNLEEYLNDLGAFPAVENIVWDGGNGRYALIENWSIAFQPSRFDTAVIRNGAATVDAVGQHAGTLKLGTQAGDDATLHIMGGWLEVAQALVIGAEDAAQATLNLSGGKLVTPLLSQGDSGNFNFTGGTLHAETVDFSLENNGGTLAPGDSPGSTTINGNYITHSGRLEIELAPLDFDTVTVNGTVMLGGELSVLLLDGFAPGSEEQFTILTGATVEGTFSNLSPLGRVEVANADASFLVTIGDGQVVLSDFTAELAGDYNDDGVVDAGDYVRWRNHLGDADESAIHHRGDGGGVGSGDYAVWKANYGAPFGGSGGLSNRSFRVPEPATAKLLLLYALVTLMGQRIRR